MSKSGQAHKMFRIFPECLDAMVAKLCVAKRKIWQGSRDDMTTYNNFPRIF